MTCVQFSLLISIYNRLYGIILCFSWRFTFRDGHRARDAFCLSSVCSKNYLAVFPK